MPGPATSKQSARKASAAKSSQLGPAVQLEFELVRYPASKNDIVFNIDAMRDTIWATPRQIAELFQSDIKTVNAHVKAIFEEGELDEATCSLPRPSKHRNRAVTERQHNLDVILAVGYRVSSQKATRFRKWATQALHTYLVHGYCVTDEYLRDVTTPNDLAEKLTRIRSTETSIYESVREFFKAAAHDYDATAEACTYFDEIMQSKFIFAITCQMPSEILDSRADHAQPNMGLQTFAGTIPTMDDAKLSQNYLSQDELYQLHILCEQFLLYVRSLAVRRKQMTMQDLIGKMDALLQVADYPVYQGYKDFYREKALRHAQAEYAMFAIRQRPKE